MQSPLGKAKSSPRRGGGRNVTDDVDAAFSRKELSLAGDDPSRAIWLGRLEGPLGPIAIALVLHRFFWRNEATAMSAKRFGDQLARRIVAEHGEGPARLDPRYLGGWVQAARTVALPDPKLAPMVMRALRRLALDLGVEENKVAALGEPMSPANLLERLTGARVTPPTADDESISIDPLFARKDPELYNPDHEAVIEIVGDVLLGSVGKTHIISLFGPSYAGKRAALGHLIQTRLLTNELGLRVFARHGFGSFHDVIADIGRFNGLHVRTPIDRDSINEIIRGLRSSTARPAVYILGMIPDAAAPFTHLADRHSLVELLNAILGSGKGSRILISSNVPLRRIPDLRNLSHREFPLPAPSARAFLDRWLIPGMIDEDDNKMLDGAVLALAETLMRNLVEVPGEEHDRLAGEVAMLLQTSRNHPTTDIYKSRGIIPEASILAWRIYEHQDARGKCLLRLLAMSEDGLRVSSFTSLLSEERWTREAIEKVLGELEKRLGWILFLTPDAGPWPGENRPGDPDRETLAVLTPPMRRIFEHALLNPDSDPALADATLQAEVRRENWRIAALARERANCLGLAVPGAAAHVDAHIERRAFALQRALVSIDPNAHVPTSDPSPPASTKESGGRPSPTAIERCLLLQPGDSVAVLSAVDRVRFLYNEWLRNDLGVGNQLRLRLEDDRLRLSLLLGFTSIGRPVYSDSYDVKDLFASWSFLERCLSAQERLDILMAITGAATRHGSWLIAMRAGAYARVLRKTEKLSLLDIERIERHRIDILLLTVGKRDFKSVRKAPQEADSDAAPEPKRSEIQRLRQGIDRMYDSYAKQQTSDASIAGQVKLLARRAEVNIFLGQYARAYRDLLRAELAESNSVYSGKTRVLAKAPRTAISGKSGRIFIHLLIDLARDRRGDERHEELLRHARDLQMINMRRLARHPAERPVVALLEARLLLAEAEFGKYYMSPGRAIDRHTLLRRAEDLLLSTKFENTEAGVGLPTHLHADATTARVALDLLELAPADVLQSPEAIEQLARAAIDRLLNSAELHFLYVLGIEVRLLACRFVLYRGSHGVALNSDLLPRTTQELLAETHRSITAIGYKRGEIELKDLREKLALAADGTLSRCLKQGQIIAKL